MHFKRTHALARQVRGVEGLGGCVAIDENRTVADYAGQDIRNRTENREKVLPEKESYTRIN